MEFAGDFEYRRVPVCHVVIRRAVATRLNFDKPVYRRVPVCHVVILLSLALEREREIPVCTCTRRYALQSARNATGRACKKVQCKYYLQTLPVASFQESANCSSACSGSCWLLAS